ncbi:MAG: SH3 domain-containing protein, partial [bacterium]
GPGTGYEKVASLIKGEELEEENVSGAWIEVRCLKGNNEGMRGFVHKDYITEAYTRNLEKETKMADAPSPGQEAEDYYGDSYGSDTLIAKDDLKMIKSLQEKMRKEALFFLSLLKQMEPHLGDDSLAVDVVEKVKVIQAGATILDNFMPGSKVIHYPFFNESFKVTEELDDYFQVELTRGIKGYIQKRFIQYYTESRKKAVVTFKGVDQNEVAGLLSQLNDIYLSISGNKEVADALARKYTLDHANLGEFAENYRKINKYYQYVKKFYEEFNLERDFKYFGTRESFWDKLTLWGELMLGDESRDSKYVAANDDLAINASFQKKKEIMLQEFGNTNISGDVHYLGAEDLDVLFRTRYNAYRSPDNENAEFNNFTVGSDLAYRLSNSVGLMMNYNLHSYNYINDEQNNYKMHSILGGIDHKTISNVLMNLKVLYESETGELNNHQFTHLNPYLQIIKREKGRYFKTRLVYDSYAFKDFKEGNYQKIKTEFNWVGSRSHYLLGGFYKGYPHKEMGNYWQTTTQLSWNSRDLNKRTVISIYNNFFPNNNKNNYSNLRFVFGTMSSNFNIVLTAWHNPGDPDKGEAEKPHIVDIYTKFDISALVNLIFGLNPKYLRMGPVAGMHANLISSEFEEKKWFERDGNLYRLGGFFNLNYPVNDKVRITGNGTYEQGNVYTNNYTGFNDSTGDIEIDAEDPIFLRRPVTYQVNMRLDYRISLIVNLVLRTGFYKVRTDFNEIPGSYPLKSNSRFFILAGINFHRN